MMDNPTVVNVSQNDLIALYPSQEQGKKPEIIKAEYVVESLKDIIENNMENILNKKLEAKDINPPVDRIVNYEVKERQLWFQDGFRCELLNFEDQSWQEGKFRINLSFNLEFIPDVVESEESAEDEQSQDSNSPLDEIRQSMQ
ncbi:MAG: hypothetical protein F6K30_24955 [Cyanothece sp. SIO2G6]|nr:hypothetical protein [Cyanothece sp. SIO2G6]